MSTETVQEENKFAKFVQIDPKVTEDFLKDLKAKHRKIMVSVLNGVVYIYRPITRLEWTNIVSGLKVGEQATALQVDSLIEDKVMERCLLYPSHNPTDYSGLPAGTLATLQKAIMYFSDFVDVDTVVAMAEIL